MLATVYSRSGSSGEPSTCVTLPSTSMTPSSHCIMKGFGFARVAATPAASTLPGSVTHPMQVPSLNSLLRLFIEKCASGARTPAPRIVPPAIRTASTRAPFRLAELSASLTVVHRKSPIAQRRSRCADSSGRKRSGIRRAACALSAP